MCSPLSCFVNAWICTAQAGEMSKSRFLWVNDNFSSVCCVPVNKIYIYEYISVMEMRSCITLLVNHRPEQSWTCWVEWDQRNTSVQANRSIPLFGLNLLYLRKWSSQEWTRYLGAETRSQGQTLISKHCSGTVVDGLPTFYLVCVSSGCDFCFIISYRSVSESFS